MGCEIASCDYSGDEWNFVELPIKKIRLDGGTQSRDVLVNEVIAEYAEAYRRGVELPPVSVFFDGKDYWLSDGFHRVKASLKAMLTTIDCRVKLGTKRDAILHMLGANEEHGLRRTNNDKRRAVMRLLDDPEWCLWSNAVIANICKVSDGLVRALRPHSVEPGSYEGSRKAIRGGKEYTVSRPIRKDSVPAIVPMQINPPDPIPTRLSPLQEFKSHLNRIGVSFQTDKRTAFGMVPLVTQDASYEFAAYLNPAAFRDAFASVLLHRAELAKENPRIKSVIVIGQMAPEMEPFLAAAREFKVEVRPIG